MTTFISFITAALLAFLGAFGFTAHSSTPVVSSTSSTLATTTFIAAKSLPAKPAPHTTATLTALGTSYTIIADTNVYEAMRALTKNSAFTFAGQNYPSLGYFVETINGKKAGAGYNWMLYANGKYSDFGASSLQVHPGDTIEWKYEKGY